MKKISMRVENISPEALKTLLTRFVTYLAASNVANFELPIAPKLTPTESPVKRMSQRYKVNKAR